MYASTSPLHPAVPAWQLRYLATDVPAQGRGFGEAALRRLAREARQRGADELWANGCDSALGFYRHEGWDVIPGSEHLSPYTQLPHTVIWLALDATV